VLPEMSAKVAFLSQEVSADQQKPVTAVNAGAFAQRDGRTVLLVVRDDLAVAVPVTPGAGLGELTAITGEVKPGEKAVMKPPSSLQGGQPVRIGQK